MKIRFPFVCMAVIVLCAITANDASAALTYVKLLQEPGVSVGHVLGVPHGGNAHALSPVDRARAAKVRKYNASARRANHYMEQIVHEQDRILRARVHADWQYRATGDSSYVKAYQQQYQQAMQLIARLSRLRNQELSYQQNLVRQH